MKMWMDRQSNRRNYTSFERNLAMMVICVPVKFEFDWTNHFRIRVRKQKNVDGQMDVGHIYLIGGLVTCNSPKNRKFTVSVFSVNPIYKKMKFCKFNI